MHDPSSGFRIYPEIRFSSLHRHRHTPRNMVQRREAAGDVARDFLARNAPSSVASQLSSRFKYDRIQMTDVMLVNVALPDSPPSEATTGTARPRMMYQNR